MLPFTSLDAATTAPNDGAVQDYEDVLGHHTMRLVVTGNPTDLTVSMLGSHDAVDWFPLVVISGAKRTESSDGANEHNVRYVKARLDVLSGGTDPTVTATIASL